MGIISRITDFQAEIASWRQDIHANPELQFDVHRTAAMVRDKLQSFGVDDIVEGIGRTGVVGIVNGRRTDSGKTIGLRADMDALPIRELQDRAYKSTVDGKMHACGHDGHTAMLLGAARYLAETRNFNGRVALIFQPAEEGGAGGREMVRDGMMERFAIAEVYGLHNMPGIPAGHIRTRPGGIMAAADFFSLHIDGRGGHAAKPHQCIDPAIIASQIVQAFQTIVSRNTDPVESMVISTTRIEMGDTNNVIPQTAFMAGTVRTLKPDLRDFAERRMAETCQYIGLAHGAKIDFVFDRNYPPTVNHEAQTAFAASVAREVVGEDQVNANAPPVMGGEDFSFMLEARPGAFLFLGQGDTHGLHHPRYDFNDAVIPTGCSFWVRLAERALPA